MNKPTIEKELEKQKKIQIKQRTKEDRKIIDMGYFASEVDEIFDSAIQNTLKELKKKIFCVRCSYNIGHDYNVETNETIHEYVYYESDWEDAFGGINDGKRN